jgi:hypothetical protein
LSYGRLGANGQERSGIEKSFTEEELQKVEKVFVEHCKIILNRVSLFELTSWRLTLHLLKSFDDKYIDEYMAKSLKYDKNVVIYIYYLTSSWIGSGVSYEIKNAPYDYVTPKRIIEAIDNMIASKELFTLEQDTQERAAAFYLNSLGKVSYDGNITQKDAIAFLEEKKQNKFGLSQNSVI